MKPAAFTRYIMKLSIRQLKHKCKQLKIFLFVLGPLSKRLHFQGRAGWLFKRLIPNVVKWVAVKLKWMVGLSVFTMKINEMSVSKFDSWDLCCELRLVELPVSNNAVCWVCNENGLELILSTLEWSNLLFYTCCIAMILVKLKCHFLSGCSSLKSHPISKCFTILKWNHSFFNIHVLFCIYWENIHFSDH